MNALKMIDKAINRKKQDTVIVDGIEYEINTDFLCWYTFELKYDGYKNGRYDLRRFDNLYYFDFDENGKMTSIVPPDREKGFAQLLKFYLEPFGGIDRDERVSDYDIADLWEPFNDLHGIDLSSDELHFHRFVVILHSLEEKGLVKKVNIDIDDAWKYFGGDISPL